MKTNNIIKLTSRILKFKDNAESTAFFIEGLAYRLTKNNDITRVYICNEDFSDRVITHEYNDYLNVNREIETIIYKSDELRESHNIKKRLRKVTNQQA